MRQGKYPKNTINVKNCHYEIGEGGKMDDISDLKIYTDLEMVSNKLQDNEPGNCI